MIIGIFDTRSQGSELKEDLLRVSTLGSRERKASPVSVWVNQHLAMCYMTPNIETLDESPQPYMNEDQSAVLVFDGKIYNTQEIKDLPGCNPTLRRERSGEVLLDLYERYRDDFLDRVNGKFALALWDAKDRRLLLSRDRLGIQSLFYFQQGNRFIFSSSVRGLLTAKGVTKRLNHQAVLQYLLFCYNPGDETLIKGIYKFPAGHVMVLNDHGVSMRKYWCLSFAEVQEKSESEYREEVIDLITDSVKIRLEPKSSPGIFLSGGTDSSAIVSLTSNMLNEPLHTFSYRCEGRSFDESYYARLVAKRYQTEHNEIPYDADRLCLISKLVESMDEPFCDAGNEIGTYILGEAARGKVSYVFSGEGGDELFAGHPVYTADKLAVVADRIPRAIMKPMTWMLQKLPDSDQKKNLQVKLKRFAYGLSFPPELLSHRWRTYYTPQELQQLCTVEFMHHCDMQKMFEGILKYNKMADGKDLLSLSIYSDFMTMVGTYFRRLGMLRTFLIESRLPLLDHRLVEYSAKIPARLKIRGLSDTKHIYKRILKEVLPREILYERPKIGHSIPMKNWLRENPKAMEFIMDVLSDGSFEKRELFQRDFIHKMVNGHVSKLNNNSHRIWGLIVLELWLRTYLQ